MPVARARARASVALVLATLVAGLALVAVGLSASVAPGAQADPAPLRIRMFGDSVMLGARDDLMAAFSGTDVAVDAVESRSLLGTTPVLAAHPELLGDVVVFDLGYNDMADAGVFHDRIDAMMQSIPSVRRVIWLTQSLFQPARAAMNDELRAAAQRYPNLDVVDWDAQVSAHPEDVYADGLHLTPAGRSAFAALVKARVDAYRASLVVPASTRAPVTTAGSGSGVGAVAGAVEQRAAASAASPEEGPTGRTVAAVAVGLVALVLLAGVVLVRRAATSRRADADQSNWQRPVPTHNSHSGAPPVA